jgi:hypothetical protein
MKRQKISTLTHTSREVAIDFLRWREEQKNKSMIGHNGCPFDNDDGELILRKKEYR